MNGRATIHNFNYMWMCHFINQISLTDRKTHILSPTVLKCGKCNMDDITHILHGAQQQKRKRCGWNNTCAVSKLSTKNVEANNETTRILCYHIYIHHHVLQKLMFYVQKCYTWRVWTLNSQSLTHCVTASGCFSALSLGRLWLCTRWKNHTTGRHPASTSLLRILHLLTPGGMLLLIACDSNGNNV